MVKYATGVSILLLVGITFMTSFLSCKKQSDGGGASNNKDFEIEFIKVWGGENLKAKDATTVSGSASEKTLEVKVSNCNNYKMEYELKSVKGSKDSRAGKATVDPFKIEKGKSELFIKLTASGYNPTEKLITITREDTSAPRIKVMLKRAEDENPVEVVNGGEYPTAQTSATVTVVSEGDAVMQKVSIAGAEATLSNEGKKAEKTGVANGNVEVVAQFEYFKDYKVSFSLKKVEAGQVPVTVVKGVVFSGDGYETKSLLTFDATNTATVSLDNIQYSCVKLEMDVDVPLEAGSGLEECVDERSATYSTNPQEKDLKGIFSGKLTKELDNKGNVIKEYETPIEGKKLTEYLIAALGTVEYKFKLSADDRKETVYTVKITNNKEDKVPYSGQGAKFYTSQGYGSSFFISGAIFWRWTTYSKLPINSQEAFQKIADLEYMGDQVRMLFAKLNDAIPGDMYFYYNIFNDPASKKHEFVRVKSVSNASATFVKPSFDPDGKHVDAFVAFKDFLPQALLPLQTQKKWSKIVDKGFLFQVENDLKYGSGNDEQTSMDIFYDAFNYRVQAKTYQADQILKIGYEQDYAYMLDDSVKTIKDQPFLHGGKAKYKEGEERPVDLMVMIPTFTGKIGDSIENIKYTIKKNGLAEADWTDVSLTPSKWDLWLCLNAKDANIENGGLKGFSSMYVFEKETSGQKNYYEIDVTIKPKNGTEKTFKYRIDYKDKQTVTSMSLENEPSGESNLFGVPTSFVESVNREAYAVLKEAMGQEFAREKLINR